MKTIKKNWDDAKITSKIDDSLSNFDDGELFVEETFSENVTFDDNKVKSASFDNEKGFGLRGVTGDSVSFYHSSELDDKNVDKEERTSNCESYGTKSILIIFQQKHT